jgi:hypothetical protein
LQITVYSSEIPRVIESAKQKMAGFFAASLTKMNPDFQPNVEKGKVWVHGWRILDCLLDL